MNILKIANGFSLPVDLTTQVEVILAKRRAGKSYTMRRVVEQLLDAEQQIVLVDPKGDQWGLRSSADGKKPGYPVLILGGEHGDLPLEVSGGEVVARLAVEERVSVLLDLSQFRKHELATFMTAFLENLYRLKAQEKYRTPVKLVVDEADAIAPQKPQRGEERMLGAIEDIVRRGGQRGIGCTLVSQRSAVLNKNVLTQAQMLVVLRTIAPQDIAAMKAWIDVHGTAEQGKTLIELLPSLPIGDAWFWSPGWPTEEGIFKRVHVLPIETFDSGATPKPGQKQIIPKNLADVDLDALKGQMAATIEKKKQDDPRELRKRIAELERDVQKPLAVQSQKMVEVPVLKDAQVVRLEKIFDKMILEANRHGNAMALLWGNFDEVGKALLGALEAIGKFNKASAGVSPTRITLPQHKERNTTPAVPADALSGISAPQRRILNALAWLESANIETPDRSQVAALSEQSPRSSGYSNNLSSLRTGGFISYPAPNTLSLTSEGRAIASAPTESLRGEDVQARVRDIVSRPQWAIIEASIRAYPEDLSRADLAERSGQSATSSGFSNNLSALRSSGFIDYSAPNRVKAANILFL